MSTPKLKLDVHSSCIRAHFHLVILSSEQLFVLITSFFSFFFHINLLQKLTHCHSLCSSMRNSPSALRIKAVMTRLKLLRNKRSKFWCPLLARTLRKQCHVASCSRQSRKTDSRSRNDRRLHLPVVAQNEREESASRA